MEERTSTNCFVPSPLTLGTVQLGLAYGVANETGLPDEMDARAILDAAVAAGICTVDTAPIYGLAEARIGRWLAARNDHATIRIVTKIPAMPTMADARKRCEHIDFALDKSITALGRQPLDLVLVHRGENLLNPTVLAHLQAAQRDGQITAFGASVYTAGVALQLMRSVPLAALQVPLSLVDRRMISAGVTALAQKLGVRVFARSIFLQGAMLMAPDRLPAHLAPLGPVIVALSRVLSDAGLTLSEAALIAVRDTPGVDSVVIGVERAEQLKSHLAAVRLPPLSADLDEAIRSIVEPIPTAVLDPSNWPR